MSQREELIVTDKNGVRGVVNVKAAAPFDGTGPQVLVRLDDGRQVIVPTEALVARKEDGYFLPFSLSELETTTTTTPTDADDAAPSTAQRADVLAKRADAPPVRAPTTEQVVVPVIAEELQIEKRRIETGRVRITKRVHEHEETIDEPLLREEVDVQRVPINRIVEAAPPIRYEGDTMIVPLLEEVFVVEKRLMLKEELRVTRRQTEHHEPQTVVLRREEAVIERVDPQAADAATGREH